MIKKPNVPYLKLWELAKEWNRKFKGCDISVDDILRYGINGDLTICVELPQYESCEFEEVIYMDVADFAKRYPNAFRDQLGKKKWQEKFPVGGKRYEGSYIEPLQKKSLQTIYLAGAVKLEELQDPLNPNRSLRHKKVNFLDPSVYFCDYELKDEPFPTLTKKNLCVLCEDIIAFEEKYFLSEESANAVNKINSISPATNQVINEIGVHNNADNNSFAPELAIANEIWNYLYVENQIKKGKNIKFQVAAWLKNNKDKYAKYFIHAKGTDFPSPELCKRLSTVITPQARKGGGVESIE